MADFYNEIKNWAQGVITSIEGDHGDPSWLTDAKNTQFVRLGMGTAALGSRPCIRTTMRVLPTTVDPPVEFTHMQPYAYTVGPLTNYTNYLACLDTLGALYFKAPDDGWLNQTIQLLNDVYATKWFTDTTHVDSAVMNNRLLMVNSKGERRSVLGTVETAFGLRTPPAVGLSAAATVLTGQTNVLPADTYNVYVTYYNPDLDAESSPSPMTSITTTTGQVIRVGLNNFATTAYSTEEAALYKYFRIYLQRTSTQAGAYLVTKVLTGAGENVSKESPAIQTNNFWQGEITLPPGVTNVAQIDGSLPLTTDARYINLSAAEIADNVIPVPLSGENTALPGSVLYLATYGRRLIGADRRRIYWSKIDKPDAFPVENFEVVDTGEGDEITGIFPSGEDMLVIFTKSAIFGLFGNDPQNWTLRAIDTTIGCVGHKSVVEFEGNLAWWSSQFGPVVMQGTSIEKIGLEQLGRGAWEYGPEFEKVKGGWDPSHDVILWALPDGADSTKFSKVLPFNYRAKSWCASEWDVLPIGALATTYDQRGNQRLFASDRSCNVGYFDSRLSSEGLLGTTTTTGTVTAGATSIGNFTDGTASFFTQSAGLTPVTLSLKDRSITLSNVTTGAVVGVGRITVNTGTSVTWLPEIAVTNGQTYRYVIGAPPVAAPTRWFDGEQAFLRKRFDRVYVQVGSDDVTYPIYVDSQINQDSTVSTSVGTITPEAIATATTDATWSVSVLALTGLKFKRLNIFRSAQSLRLIFRQAEAVPMILVKIGILGRTLSDRYLK